MRLDRNDIVLRNGLKSSGKYALIKMRKLQEFAAIAAKWEETRELPESESDRINVFSFQIAKNALETLERLGVIEYGEPNMEAEFFVIKLRDRHALVALEAYANSVYKTMAFEVKTDEARESLREYANDIDVLTLRAGTKSPFCKDPD